MTVPNLVIGAPVIIGKQRGIITEIAGSDDFAVSIDGQPPKIYTLAEITEGIDGESKPGPSLDEATAADFKLAADIFAVLKPFLLYEKKGRRALEEHLNEVKPDPKLRLSVASCYRRIQAYRAHEVLLSLLPGKHDGGRGKSRLNDALQDQAMQTAIDRFVLIKKKPRRKIKDIYDNELPTFCKLLRCSPPSYGTFCRRVNTIDPGKKVLKQEGYNAWKAKYGQNKGSNPLTEYPLSCVQMDYWHVHAVCVDPWLRLAVGRPTLCLASDTFSGMPYGYYLSYDPPNAGFAGLATYFGAMPKTNLLKRLKIEMSWPVWSLPHILHLDNAKDFRGEMLKGTLSNHGCTVAHRPVRTPHFGGSIESQFAKFATRIVKVAGATGSNINDKSGDPSDDATMTIDELEIYLVNLLKIHINERPAKGELSPLEKWNNYFFDSKKNIVNPLFPLPADPTKLRIELMPFFECTLGPKGIRLDYMYYDSKQLTALKPVLDHKGNRRIRVRRDPRNISSIFVFSVIENSYIEVPFADRSQAPMSLWEHRAARQHIVDNDGDVDEQSIFDAREALLKITEIAASKTRTARKQLSQAEHGLRMAEEDRPKLFGDADDVGEPERGDKDDPRPRSRDLRPEGSNGSELGKAAKVEPGAEAPEEEGAVKPGRFRDLGYRT